MSYELSIIIPAYQAEEHLDRCLSSLLGQLSCPTEVIVVNDASTDGTMDIVRSFAEKHPQELKIIQNPCNQGVSASRNNGLAAASGRLVMFVDADDWIDGQGCMRLIDLQRQTNAELTCGLFCEITPGRDDKVRFAKRHGVIAVDPQHKFSDMIPHLRLLDNCWGKLFVAELIRQRNLSFSTSLRYGEDILFTHAYMVAAKSVVFDYDCAFYRYFQHATSCVHTIDPLARQQQLDILLIELAKLSSDMLVSDSILLRKAIKVLFCIRRIPGTSQDKKDLLRHFWTSPAFKLGLYECIDRRGKPWHRLLWKLLKVSKNGWDATLVRHW